MKTIQIKTEIPGPKSRALVARREAAIPRGPSLVTPVCAAKSEGAWIEDLDGNRFIDFAGGIGCLNMGHRAPLVDKAIREQLDKYLHLCFGVTPYEPYVALAEKLNSLAPIKGPVKTMFINTGAEAFRLVRDVGDPNVKMIIDYYHLAQEHEDPQILETARDAIVHLHFANPAGRVWPKDPAEDPGYAPFFAMVKKIGFRGGLSIEGRGTFEADAAASLEFFRKELE